MTPGAHLLFSWLSTVQIIENRRERLLVSLCGVAPDLDGLGLLIDRFTGVTHYYLSYHHYLGHSVLSAFVLASLAALLAKQQRLSVWLLGLFVVHLHVMCDVIGSKGPDGYHWPVYYLFPFSDYGLTWTGQWELDAWQNQVIMLFLLATSVYVAATRNISFLEVISRTLDREAFKLYEKYVNSRLK